MKYKITWMSPTQGINSTEVEALNMTAAADQVKSMYSQIDGFKVVTVSPVFEKKEYSQPQESYSSNQASQSGGSEGFDSVSSAVGSVAFAAGGIIALVGLFTLPVGIVAMVIGGAVGWLGWKLACWLDDRGW